MTALQRSGLHIRALLLAVFFSTLSLPVDAQTIQAITEEHRPYSFIEDGDPAGPATDVVKMVLDEAGLDFELTLYPWARAYQRALNHENTLIYPISRTDVREVHFHWIGPVMPASRWCYYRLDGNKASLPKPKETTRSSLIGVRRDTDKHHYLVSLGYKNLVLADSVRQLVSLMVRGRVDFILINEHGIAAYGDTVAAPRPHIIEHAFVKETESYIALSYTTEIDVVEDVQRAYQAVIEREKAKPNLGAVAYLFRPANTPLR